MLNPADRTLTIELIARMSRLGEKIDAMTLARRFNHETERTVDWHVFSSFLDQLANRQFMKITQPGGMVTYDLNI